MISIVLIEPEVSENVGFVARSMKNFDLRDLILINPRCDLDKANKTATHAKDILNKAKVKDFSYLNNFDYLIGTTAVLGTDNNIPRNPINPEDLSKRISKLYKKTKVGILIGREGSGLSNKEINMCNIIVTIPASKKYPTMNISHAAIILFYELFKTRKEKSDSHINFATKKELQVITKLLNKTLDTIKFETKEKKDTQKKVWKKIFGKATLTKKEAFSVMGFLRKLLR